MAFDDFFKGKGKGAEAKTPGKEPAPEKKRSGKFFDQVPVEYRRNLEEIARGNHEYFEDRFPTPEEFLDAVAESWLEKRKGFEEEAARLGFTPIEPGTKASVLNKCTIAYLTESGSFVILGPGAFEGKMPQSVGAAFSYVKIPFRQNPNTPPDAVQESGVFVTATPTQGKRMEIRGLPPRYDGDPGGLSTSPVINQMMRPTARTEALTVLKDLKASVSRRFTSINEGLGIVVARPKA